MDWKVIISRPVCDILIGDHILMTGVDSASLHLPYLKIYNIPEIATEIVTYPEKYGLGFIL